jgi:hypothetical protein
VHASNIILIIYYAIKKIMLGWFVDIGGIMFDLGWLMIIFPILIVGILISMLVYTSKKKMRLFIILLEGWV